MSGLLDRTELYYRSCGCNAFGRNCEFPVSPMDFIQVDQYRPPFIKVSVKGYKEGMFHRALSMPGHKEGKEGTVRSLEDPGDDISSMLSFTSTLLQSFLQWA